MITEWQDVKGREAEKIRTAWFKLNREINMMEQIIHYYTYKGGHGCRGRR
jgi:hypothetical protein